MIFTGRLLASRTGVSIWTGDREGGYKLHLIGRGIVLDLTAEELTALGEAVAAASEAGQAPEPRKDRMRRLQILEARITDFLRREREPRPGG